MRDKLVDAVTAAAEDLAFANGIGQSALHPMVDLIVNRLRRAGMSDEAILAALAPPESEDEEAGTADPESPLVGAVA